MVRFLAAVVLSAIVSFGQQLHTSGDRIREHVKVLASNDYQGRGVGTEGENLATKYIVSQLQAAGLKPAGDNGSWFQTVPLIGSTTLPNSTMAVNNKGRKVPLEYLKDYVGTAFSQQAQNDFNAEAVFVGHGISAPEFGWDDYKGEDLHGKVLIYFTNEPPSEDPKFFGGRALTYYGRWTYKYEEAKRRGAVAALIIHTDQTAGYGWEVVRGSWSGEHPELRLGNGETGLKFAGWLSSAAGQKLIASTGKTIPELLAMADQKSFRPIHLGVQIDAHILEKLRAIESRNVIGVVRGSDQQISSQYVIFSAHWDHFGIGVPVNGDKIYHGAVDNASGCAVVLELARLWAALPQKPKRSALFLFVTAEESGLLGSEYYGEHPEAPAAKTAADLNFDMVYPYGRTKDIFVGGAERTTLWPLVERDARSAGLTISPDPEPEQGHYYRSDHFSLARVGIPAFSIMQGKIYVGKPADFGTRMFDEFNATKYHHPADKYDPSWDVSGMEQITQFGLKLGLDIANSPAIPTWKPGDEFLSARQKSGVQ